MSATPFPRGNRWDEVAPPRDHRWTPTATVSVCIPAKNHVDNLRRTLSALTVQTYPTDLIEVIVADDGSAPPLPREWDLPIRVRTVDARPDGRFGAGRARNAAARHATGDILVFLDADIIPEREVVEAYARWFSRYEHCVVTGFISFADMSHLSDDALIDHLRQGTLSAELASADVDDQEWRVDVVRRTGHLRRESNSTYKIVVGATVAVSAEQFRSLGGFRELGVRGIEDTEFGYRFHADGAVFVPDAAARHWHQGRRTIAANRAEINAIRAPYMERLLPVGDYRPDPILGDGPVATVPTLRFHLDEWNGSTEPLVASGSLGEACQVAAPGVPPDFAVPDGAFATVSGSRRARWSLVAVDEVVRRFDTSGAGVLHVLGMPGRAPLTIRRTRAYRRAATVLGTNDLAQLDPWVADAFGETWDTPGGLGLDVAPPSGPN